MTRTAKENSIEKYLDEHQTTAYKAAKLANISQSTMYDAINLSRDLNKQTIAIIKAVAKAVNRKPGQVLERLIEIEDSSNLEFDSLGAYKFYLGLLSYLVDDFKVRKYQEARPSFRLSSEDIALYIKMFFGIRSVLQWLSETFGDQIVAKLLTSNELSTLFQVKQKPINFERSYDDKDFDKFFHEEHDYEISILSINDINTIFDYIVDNISTIKEQINDRSSKDALEDSNLKKYGTELLMSIHNDIVELILEDPEITDEKLKNEINENRDDWIEEAGATPNLKIIAYACTEVNEFEVEPMFISYLPKEIKDKYGFSLPKIESFLNESNSTIIRFNAIKNKIEIADSELEINAEWFENILEDLDFDEHEEWLKFIDEVEFESYKKYIYSLNDKSYDNIFEATKIYQN